jgi:hypothetical protein
LFLVVLSEGVLGMQEVLWERLMEVLQGAPSLEDVLRNSWLAAQFFSRVRAVVSE